MDTLPWMREISSFLGFYQELKWLLPITIVNRASDLKLRARLPLKWTTQRTIINYLGHNKLKCKRPSQSTVEKRCQNLWRRNWMKVIRKVNFVHFLICSCQPAQVGNLPWFWRAKFLKVIDLIFIGCLNVNFGLPKYKCL